MSYVNVRRNELGLSVRNRGDWKLALLALALFCPVASAQSPLQCGTPVSGQFTSPGQIDRYSIAVNSGDVMSIRATNGNLEVYDPTGKPVATGSFGQPLSVSATSSGTYLLLVSQISGFGPAYAVAFQRLNRPCGTSVLSCGEQKSGTLASTIAMDSYVLSVNAGDIMSVRATNGNLEVYDPAGKSVVTGSFGQPLNVTATATGPYLLLVNQISGFGPAYAVAFQRLNRPCGTSVLSCGEQRSGTLANTIAMVSYSLSVNAGDIMSIRATNGNLEIYDPAGKSVSMGSFGQPLKITATSTGAYLLLVNQISGFGPAYAVAFQRLNRPCGTSVLSCGDQRSGTLPNTIAMVPYALSVNAGDIISIRATNGNLEVYDPAGKTVATGSFGQPLNITAATAGAYLLLVNQISGFGPEYSVTYVRLNGGCQSVNLLSLTSLSPTSATAGGSTFTLAASGSGFLNTAVVLWNGSALATTFVNAGQLTATVPANLIAAAGSASVTIQNSAGVTTNALTFAMNPPSLTLSSVSPNTATAGGPAFTLAANGAGFVNSSVILWNGSALTTTFINATQLTAAVPANLIAAQGSANVSVQNAAGVVSSALPFSITAQLLTLSSISPNAVTAGGAPFLLTASGAGFLNTFAIQWNGSPLATTYISATQLTATVAASLIAAPGNASVRVQNPAGVTSGVLTIVINPPQLTLSSLTPNTATAGGPAFLLTANGSGFLNTAAILWNGSALPTTFVTANQLTATVPSALIATQSNAIVSVQNSAGVISSVTTFVISSAQLTLSSIFPNTATAGGPALLLTANGSGFLNTAAILWNGSALPTTFVAANQLTATVPATLIATQGNASVSVQNSAGVVSNVATLAISSSQLTLSSISPNTASAGGPAFLLTTNGAGFVNNSIVLWNGSALSTTFVNSTQLTASVPANLIATQGNVSVSVQNGAGIFSNVLTFVINAQPLTLISLTPNSATTGGPAFTIVAVGTGFVSNSIVLWNGSPLSTTFVTASQLTAAVPANLIASAGSASVSIQNSAGIFSNVLTFVTNPPQPGGFTILTPSPLPSGAFGASYAQGLLATGGATPYKNWTLVSGSLPPGLSLTAGVLSGTGLLSGTPTSGGTFGFAVQVLDNANIIATKVFALTITGGATTLTSRGIVNSASYEGGGIAPGEIITIFGSFPGPSSLVTLQLDNRGYVSTNLGGEQLLFDGIAAPMIYAVAGQVSAIVPYGVFGKSSVQIQVSYQGQLSNSVAMTIAAVAPGIFTSESSGKGQGAIVNQDGTINSESNPAAAGSIVFVYATGEGQTTPGGVDGKPADSPAPTPTGQPVTATVGGASAQVLYAGGVPGLVAGLLQVNVQLPAGVTLGSFVPIVLTIGGKSSQIGVTLAVR